MKTRLIKNIHKISTNPISRFILGDDMDAANSKIFHKSGFQSGTSPLPFILDEDVPTGSIGFLDFQIMPKEVPTVDFDKTQKTATCLVLKLLIVGIEPEYRNKGYANTLINLAKEYGISQGCKAVWYDVVEDEFLKNKYRRAGLRQIGYSFVEYLS